MDLDLTPEQEMLLTTVKRFMDEELYPHEAEVDRVGQVPIELGRQIERRSIEVGLFAANLPEAVGGGGLDYRSMAIVEREYGKTSHALHSWIARPTEILLACEATRSSATSCPSSAARSASCLP